MTYKINGKDATRIEVLKNVGKNYLEYIESVAKNLFEIGCYEYVDEIHGKLVVSIVK